MASQKDVFPDSESTTVHAPHSGFHLSFPITWQLFKSRGLEAYSGDDCRHESVGWSQAEEGEDHELIEIILIFNPAQNELMAARLGLNSYHLANIINLPMDQLEDFAEERNFDEEQFNVLRDIRCEVQCLNRVSNDFLYEVA